MKAATKSLLSSLISRSMLADGASRKETKAVTTEIGGAGEDDALFDAAMIEILIRDFPGDHEAQVCLQTIQADHGGRREMRARVTEQQRVVERSREDERTGSQKIIDSSTKIRELWAAHKVKADAAAAKRAEAELEGKDTLVEPLLGDDAGGGKRKVNRNRLMIEPDDDRTDEAKGKAPGCGSWISSMCKRLSGR